MTAHIMCFLIRIFNNSLLQVLEGVILVYWKAGLEWHGASGNKVPSDPVAFLNLPTGLLGFSSSSSSSFSMYINCWFYE